MPDVKVGDYIRDNDPRMPGRRLQVTRFEGMRVVASVKVGSHLHETRVSLNRIYTDGKPRRSGWSLEQ